MKIGNLELRGVVVLAPMAGVTDAPFRRMVQRFGVSALWSEMISAHALVVSGKPSRTMDLDGHRAPTFFQIYGHDPSIMAQAARKLEDWGAAGVDLNMGCPVKKVVRKGAGAALMKDPPLAARITAEVRKAVTVPVTVKIRSGWDETSSNAPSFAEIAENEGADAIVVHARSRSRGHSGPVSLDVIHQVKEKVRIPVIGNGGIKTTEDARAMTDRTGCDGVMIGRATLGKPWFPGKILNDFALETESPEMNITVFDVVQDHYLRQIRQGDQLAGVRRMRKHLIWYSKGLAGAARFRETVVRLDDPDRVLETAKRFFAEVEIS